MSLSGAEPAELRVRSSLRGYLGHLRLRRATAVTTARLASPLSPSAPLGASSPIYYRRSSSNSSTAAYHRHHGSQGYVKRRRRVCCPTSRPDQTTAADSIGFATPATAPSTAAVASEPTTTSSAFHAHSIRPSSVRISPEHPTLTRSNHVTRLPSLTTVAFWLAAFSRRRYSL